MCQRSQNEITPDDVVACMYKASGMIVSLVAQVLLLVLFKLHARDK